MCGAAGHLSLRSLANRVTSCHVMSHRFVQIHRAVTSPSPTSPVVLPPPPIIIPNPALKCNHLGKFHYPPTQRRRSKSKPEGAHASSSSSVAPVVLSLEACAQDAEADRLALADAHAPPEGLLSTLDCANIDCLAVSLISTQCVGNCVCLLAAAFDIVQWKKNGFRCRSFAVLCPQS